MARLRRHLEFLAGYIELLYVWIGCGAWEDFTKRHLSGETVASLFGGAFVVLSIRNWYRLKDRLEAAKTVPGAPEPPAPRVFTDNPDSLIAQLSNPKLLTEMQVVCYVGKWITLTGVVEFAGGGNVTLTLDRGHRVAIHFTRGDRDDTLRAGDCITAVCRIQRSFAEPWVSLEQCELVHVKHRSALRTKAS